MSVGLFPIEAVVDPVLLATVRLEVLRVVVGQYGLDPSDGFDRPHVESLMDTARILTNFVLEG